MFGKHVLSRAHTLATAIMATLLLVSAACRSAPRLDHPAGKDPYLIGSEELEASVRSTLYDAIWELRPRWLTRTARQTRTEPYVYVDDQVLGTAGALRRFRPSQVAEARYLSATEAQVQFGQKNNGRPAIVVVLIRD